GSLFLLCLEGEVKDVGARPLGALVHPWALLLLSSGNVVGSTAVGTRGGRAFAGAGAGGPFTLLARLATDPGGAAGAGDASISVDREEVGRGGGHAVAIARPDLGSRSLATLLFRILLLALVGGCVPIAYRSSSCGGPPSSSQHGPVVLVQVPHPFSICGGDRIALLLGQLVRTRCRLPCCLGDSRSSRAVGPSGTSSNSSGSRRLTTSSR
ncbi:unnamed protein product, partial [Ectocarpus sp. 4 AP-2014]